MKSLGKLLSTAFVASGAVVSAQALGHGCPCALTNVDYCGHDVDKIFSGPATHCVEKCQQACQANTFCHYFTYITDRKECYLKDADASRDPRHHATAISGPKYCSGQPSFQPPVFPPSVRPFPPPPGPPPFVPQPPVKPHFPFPPHSIPQRPSVPTVTIPAPPVAPQPRPVPPVVFLDPHPPFDCPTLCFEKNVDYFGYDLKKIETGDVATPLACQQLCAQEKGCAHWTYVTAKKNCYLKTVGAPLGRKTDTGAVSGPRDCNAGPQRCFEIDIDYQGGDIRGIEGHVIVSPDECQKICQSHSECKIWTWVPIQRNCYLKSAAAARGRIPSRGVISGPQTCDGSIPPRIDPPRYPPFSVPPNQCFEYNVEYVGPTLRTCETPNLRACQARCVAEPRCEYVTFKLDLRDCALKDRSAVSNKAYRKYTYSTSKYCDLDQGPPRDPLPPVGKPDPWVPPLDGYPIPPPRPVPAPPLDGFPIPSPKPIPVPPVDEFPIPPLKPIPVPVPPHKPIPGIDGFPVHPSLPPPPYFPQPPYIDGRPVPEKPALPTCGFEVNVEYTGYTIGSTICVSATVCRRMCQLTSGCHFFTFVERHRQCHLKSDKGVAKTCPGVVSGGEVCNSAASSSVPDVCYHYDVIVGDSLGSDVAYSAPICQNLCMNKPACNYFTYNLNSGECLYFKNKLYNLSSPFSISGPRACSGGPTGTDWGFPNTTIPLLPPPGQPPQPPAVQPLPGCVHVDVDFTGHTVGVVSVPDFDACRVSCLKNSSCNCFTFVAPSRQCYLKSETGLVHHNKGCISGLRHCS